MDERAFSTRVRACSHRLWRIAWSILRNGADCDDALQNALLRAWTGIGSLRNEAFFETWLTRILINECKTLLRRRARFGVGLEENIVKEERPEQQALSDAIGALSVNLRIPLVLHYMEGYSAREIAELLRLPETTVKWRLHTARKQLKDEWTK